MNERGSCFEQLCLRMLVQINYDCIASIKLPCLVPISLAGVPPCAADPRELTYKVMLRCYLIAVG